MLYTVVITTSEVIMETSDENVYSRGDKIHFHSKGFTPGLIFLNSLKKTSKKWGVMKGNNIHMLIV